MSEQQQTLTIQQAIDLAVQHHNGGRLPQAESIYQQILQTDPNQPVALHFLGVIAHQTGKNDIAVDLITKALVIKPDIAEAHSNLGLALQELGKLDEAVASYHKALAVKPDYAEAHNNLGMLLKELEHLESAHASFHRALGIRPDFPECHNNLGNVLIQLGRPNEAVSHYRQAIDIKPDFPDAHNNLGITLLNLGRPDEALSHCRKAVVIKPKYAEAHFNLGNVLKTLGQLDEAVSHYQKAINIKPDYTRAHSSLAIAHERFNRLEAAEKCIEEALKISPADPDSHVVKGILLRRRGNVRAAIDTLERVKPESLSYDIATMRYFELGKLWDQEQESEKAFAAFHDGNRLSASRANRSSDGDVDYLAKIEGIGAVLTSEWVESWPPPSQHEMTDAPIFLIGFPRSGTTLLEQILGSHSRMQVMEEKPALLEAEKMIQSLAGGYPYAVSTLTESDIVNLRAQYFESVDRYMARIPGQLLVDKHPLNTEYVPLITRLFPEARIILALRHPCDVVLSNFMQNYRLNIAMTNFLTLDDTVRLYTRVWRIWLKCVDLLAMNFHTVKYETLVSNFETEARGLFEFLEIGWDDSAMDYHKYAQSKSYINTPSYEQVIEPVHSRAKYRWKRYENQLAPFLNELSPFIEEFGYSV